MKNRGEPKSIRQGVNQLLRFLQEMPDAYGIVVAPYVSPKSQQICDEAGVGFVDLARNCKLVIENIFIQNIGHPNPYTRDKSRASIYAPKASRVLRVLLSHSIKKIWKTKSMATETGLSYGHIHKVRKRLEDREWINDSKSGFSLKEPMELLREWTANYTFRSNRSFDFYSMDNLGQIEEKIGAGQKNGARTALTGFSGAARYAPMVRYQNIFAYVEEEPEMLALDAGFKAVNSGPNVTLLRPYDAGVFYGSRRFEGIAVVSPVQLYMDLMTMPGRGEEAAEALLEKEIKSTWQ
ncbi:MAG: hypothetical protein JSV37_10230 [Anaerolineaceae bacterium]|nr:MAG: hypothetical protein JSV37_10230 [Anaerolineaceae bacterium]